MSTAHLVNDGNVVEPPVANGKTSLHMQCGEPSKSAVLHRSLHNDPLKVVAAHGQTLCLSNGQEIFDATGGAAVSCLGHGNERSGPGRSIAPVSQD